MSVLRINTIQVQSASQSAPPARASAPAAAVGRCFFNATRSTQIAASRGPMLRAAAETGGVFVMRMQLSSIGRNLAVLDSRDTSGQNALQIATHFAMQHRADPLRRVTYIEIIRLLLTNGATVDVEDSMQNTPLMLALAGGDTRLAALFLRHGANINKSARNGHTALHNAILQDAGPVVEFILTNGGDPNARTTAGSTALVLACSKRKHDLAARLLTAGADASLGVCRGSYQEELNPLFWAAGLKDLKMMKLLVEAGARLGDTIKLGDDLHTVFSYACSVENNEAVVAFLSEHHAEFPERVRAGSVMCAIGCFPAYEKYLTSSLDKGGLAAKRLGLAAGLKNRPGAPTSYEGGQTNIFYRDMASVIKEAGLGELQHKEIEAAFRKAPSALKNKTKTLQAIQRGDLVLIPAGWKKHSITLIFFKGYYVVCNRGEGNDGHSNAEFYRIDASRVKLEDLVEMEKREKQQMERSLAAPFFYDTLPKKLTSTHDGKIHQDKRCKEFAEKFSAGLQASGNCCNASPSGALRVAMALVTFARKKRSLDADTVAKIKKVNRRVLLAVRLRYLESYLVYHPEGDPTIDAYLVQESWNRIKRQLKRNPIELDAYPQVKQRLFDPEARVLPQRVFYALGTGLSRLFSRAVEALHPEIPVFG